MASKQIASRVYWISENHPTVEVQLTIQLDSSDTFDKYGSIGIHMDPPLLPEHLRDELFSKGICSGVNAGIVDAKFPLSSDVEVEILTLSISEPLQAFSGEELQSLSNKLRELAYDVTVALLAK